MFSVHFPWILARHIKAGGPLCFGLMHTMSAEEEASSADSPSLGNANLVHKSRPRKFAVTNNFCLCRTGPHRQAAAVPLTHSKSFQLWETETDWDLLSLVTRFTPGSIMGDFSGKWSRFQSWGGKDVPAITHAHTELHMYVLVAALQLSAVLCISFGRTLAPFKTLWEISTLS